MLSKERHQTATGPIRQKARRGEHYTRIAEGYVLGDGSALEKDLDERVQRAMTLVFSTFREFGSAWQVYLWFRQEDIKRPLRIGKAAIDFVLAPPKSPSSLQ